MALTAQELRGFFQPIARLPQYFITPPCRSQGKSPSPSLWYLKQGGLSRAKIVRDVLGFNRSIMSAIAQTLSS
ncbi:MAG: hypothetical protein ACRCU2_21500, partial [Planktothrix sp.]